MGLNFLMDAHSQDQKHFLYSLKSHLKVAMLTDNKANLWGFCKNKK